VNGWRLFQYPLFENQLRILTEAMERFSIAGRIRAKNIPKPHF